MSLYCSKVYKTNVSYFWRAGMQLVSFPYPYQYERRRVWEQECTSRHFREALKVRTQCSLYCLTFVYSCITAPISPFESEVTLHENHLYWQAFNSMYVTRCVQCHCLPVDSCTPVLVEHPSLFSQPRLRPPSGNTSCLDQYFLMYQSLDCNKKGGRLKRERRIIPRL